MSIAVGLLLTVGSGLCWGGLDALRKQLSFHLGALPLTLWLLIGQWPLFTGWVLISGEHHMTLAWIAPGLGVSAIAILAAVLFIKAVQLSPLSIVIPMLSLTPVFAVLTSALMLEERLAFDQLLGIMLVVSGAFALGKTSRQSGGRGWREPGIWIMMGVAFCWACTMTLDKIALQHADVPIHALAQTLVMGTCLFVILAIRGELSHLTLIRHHQRTYLFAVLLASLATALQLIAVRVILVGIVEGIKRSIGLTMAVVNGWLFFNEPPTLLKILAIFWMGTGVLFLVL